jgi:hypothetical protein
MQGKTNARYTFTDFVKNIPMSYLLKSVENGHGVSWRGLPRRTDLQDARVADIFRTVLRRGQISAQGLVKPALDALGTCYRRGWLHNAISAGVPRYFFASTWHKRYVEYLLCGHNEGISEDSVFAFVEQVILKFSPRSLTTRVIGSSTQTIPEAQFQDEFYHASLAHTNGVMSFPEFGNKHGKIDFFIPSKKWGIELLRNGDRINTHIKRFTKGEYSKWISDGVLNDYVIIDFRTNAPRDRRGEPLQRLLLLVTVLIGLLR